MHLFISIPSVRQHGGHGGHRPPLHPHPGSHGIPHGVGQPREDDQRAGHGQVPGRLQPLLPRLLPQLLLYFVRASVSKVCSLSQVIKSFFFCSAKSLEFFHSGSMISAIIIIICSDRILTCRIKAYAHLPKVGLVVIDLITSPVVSWRGCETPPQYRGSAVILCSTTVVRGPLSAWWPAVVVC